MQGNQETRLPDTHHRYRKYEQTDNRVGSHTQIKVFLYTFHRNGLPRGTTSRQEAQNDTL